ncbi:hypothetical protein LA080_007511 [Diaporthe eres]|uniref:Uncharacterized protein n=1 Tax=Diaporthe vaccinii TaxID=105482 RepID=A0ABR4FAQ3_9PEZI|nr:hypothetical protein LA080_007511 [Diaporthe eres]
MTSPGGINALGIRMVYQSSDLAAASGTSTATSTGATKHRKRRRRGQQERCRPQRGQQPGEGAAGMPHDYSKTGYSAVAPGTGGYSDSSKSPAPPSEVSGVGAYGVRNQQQEMVELEQQEAPVELPAQHYRDYR